MTETARSAGQDGAGDADELLTTSQLAYLLRNTQGTVSRWARTGRIDGALVDEQGRWLIPRRAVEPILHRERRARSWQTQGLTRPASSRSVATQQLVAAATRWREHPHDPNAVEALIRAVDERAALVIKTSPGPRLPRVPSRPSSTRSRTGS